MSNHAHCERKIRCFVTTMEIHDKCSLHEVDSDETQILMYQTPSFSMPLLFRFILTAAGSAAVLQNCTAYWA